MTSTDLQQSPNPLVELNQVRVAYRGVEILNDISFVMEPSQHWVIVGPNGAGKTTLARLIAGREYDPEGEISVLGQQLEEHDLNDLASRVGFASVEVGQRVQPHDTVSEVVLSAAWGQGATFGEEYEQIDRGRAADLLVALGVGQLAQRQFVTLSEGERRRVLLARALMADPEILILDEPTAGLDLAGREILVGALTEIMGAPQSPGTILITHELEEIGSAFTHALVMQNGRIVAAGQIDQVLTDETLSDAFGLSLAVVRDSGRWRAFAKPER